MSKQRKPFKPAKSGGGVGFLEVNELVKTQPTTSKEVEELLKLIKNSDSAYCPTRKEIESAKNTVLNLQALQPQVSEDVEELNEAQLKYFTTEWLSWILRESDFSGLHKGIRIVKNHIAQMERELEEYKSEQNLFAIANRKVNEKNNQYKQLLDEILKMIENRLFEDTISKVEFEPILKQLKSIEEE